MLKSKFMAELRQRIKYAGEVLGPRKKPIFVVLGIILLSASLESFGISLLFPILQVVIEGEMHGKISEMLKPFLSRFPENYALLLLAGLFLLVILTKFFIYLLRVFISKKFVWKIRLQWMSRIFEKYMRSEYAFMLNHKQGKLLNNLISETQRGAICFSQSIEFLAKLILVIALTVTLLIIHWQATVILVLAIGILLLVTNRFTKNFGRRIGRTRLHLSQQLSAWAAEAISGVRQIKTFGLEKRFRGENDRIGRKLSDVQIKLAVVRAIYGPLSELLLVLFLGGVIVYISLFSDTLLKAFLPFLAVFVVVGQRLMSNISILASLRLQIIALLPSVFLSHQLSGSKIADEDLFGGLEFKGLEGNIVFDNVSFGYGGEKGKKVFERLNLTIPYGKTTAIFGASGIGKSTVADLLLRLYNPQEGQVVVNGRNLEEWNLVSWRRHIGFVSQDTFLFDMSVRDNIALGNPEAKEEDIIEAAKKAHAHDFIMELPQGYDTVIAERGVNLSGGQRQRIAIARAIVRDPDFLIFDEATNALDVESEKKVRMAIEELGKEKTILVIAHRLSTIEKTDVVYNLGKLVNGETSKDNRPSLKAAERDRS